MSHDAQVLHPSLPRGRAPGQMEVGSLDVRVQIPAEGEAPSSEVRLPLEGLRIHLGGAGDRLIFLQHARLPEWTVYTRDFTILADPGLLSVPDVAAQIAVIRSRRRTGPLWILAAVVAVVAVLGAAWAAKSAVAGRLAEEVPPTWEQKLGDLVYAQHVVSHPPLTDPKLQAALDHFAGHLERAALDKRYPLHFHVVAESQLNAFALPGGHVILNSQVVLEAESAGEVLGVLGHELAHVTHRHAIRAILNAVGGFVLFQFLLGDVSGVFAVLQDAGPQLLAQQFSRDQERDADDAGLDYLLAAGVDPRGLPRFFERIEMKAAEGPLAKIEEKLQFLSTHPQTAERIAHLNQRIDQLGKRTYKDRDPEFRVLQQLLRAALAEGRTAPVAPPETPTPVEEDSP